jgi:hypothetical protein
LAKVIEASTLTTTATEYKPKTISDMQEIYDLIHKFEKQANNEKAFLAKFHSRKQWLSQFKRQPYDGVA